MNTVEYPAAVICVSNEGNEASLQLWKVYKPLRDNDARSEGFFRVVDESGEDYLFPEENFVPIELPSEVRRPFEKSVRKQRRALSPQRVSNSVRRVAAASVKKSSKPNPAGRLTRRRS
jgi:hypothetical protein